MIVDPATSVFLSYRRARSWTMARLVREHLARRGFDVFMDVESINSGEFGPTILTQIEARTHFVVLLEPTSLERIAEDGDWLRREIAHALRHGRNVVPLTADGFQMPAAPTLPEDVRRLVGLNAVPIIHHYFDAAMQKLCDQFLTAPGAPVVTPPIRPLAGDVDAAVVGTRSSSAVAPVRLGTPAVSIVGSRMLSWTDVVGATEFELQGMPDSNSVDWRPVYRGSGRTHRVTEALAPPGRLYRVRALGVEGIEPGRWSVAVKLPRLTASARDKTDWQQVLHEPEPRPAVGRRSGPLDAPSSTKSVLTANRRMGSARLAWTAVPRARLYVVERFHSLRSREGDGVEVYRGPDLGYTDLLGAIFGARGYRVQGIDARGEPASAWSEIVHLS